MQSCKLFKEYPALALCVLMLPPPPGTRSIREPLPLRLLDERSPPLSRCSHCDSFHTGSRRASRPKSLRSKKQSPPQPLPLRRSSSSRVSNAPMLPFTSRISRTSRTLCTSTRRRGRWPSRSSRREVHSRFTADLAQTCSTRSRCNCGSFPRGEPRPIRDPGS